MSKEVIGYFFSPVDCKLRHGDGRLIGLSKQHSVNKPVVICHNGLHASIRPLDALKYAPGPVLWKVKLSGELVEEDDKIAAEHREYLGGGKDISEQLGKFGRDQALKLIDKWNCPSVVKEWLETGNVDLKSAAEAAAGSAARSAARSAAEAAVGSAARSAVRSAAWSAAGSAARSAAGSAARSAAEAAAWSAAWSAARSAAWSAAGSAARSAAWSAARSAAGSVQNEELQDIFDSVCEDCYG